MAWVVSISCVIGLLICIPLSVLRPRIVFYAFLASAVFDSIFAGYITAVNNLGLGESWRPADILFPLTLVAAIFVRREWQLPRSVIEKVLILLAVMTSLALLQGLVRNFGTAVMWSRGAHIVAAVAFGLRYLATEQRVKEFFKFTTVLLMVMFVLHVLIRFAIYTPPIMAEVERASTQLEGERGGVSLVPLLYLALMSVATARLLGRVGLNWLSAFLLLCGVAGTLLSENRSMYGSAVVLALAALVFVKGRIKAAFVYSLVGLVAVCAAAALNFDILARFRTRYDRGNLVNPLRTIDDVRARELKSLIDSYANEPVFLLAGRGVGAMHFLPGHKNQILRAYYHCEYLMWLDRCGLIGFAGIIVLFVACMGRSLILARSDIGPLKFLGVTCFLLTITLAAEGFFHPVFTHLRGASLLICFPAILANWQSIYLSLQVPAAPYRAGLSPEVVYPFPAGAWRPA